MPSSTSSSDARASRRRWLLTSAIAGACLLASLTVVERYWRRHGFTPGVIDSMQLWSLQRDQARHAAPRPLVFLGASRTLFGIDLPTARAMLPGWQPLMLALNGRYPLAALRDLAEDDAFRGTVVFDIDSRGLARSNHAAQMPHVRHYHDQWSPSWRWHRQFLNHWQGRLALGNPDLAIVRVLQRRAAGQPRPELPTHTTAPDRDSRLDFSRVDAAVLAAGFERGLRDALQVDPPPPVAQWQADLAELPGLIARIRQRGGDVIFYTPPVSGAQDTLAEAAFPRAAYWNPLVERLGVHALVGNDVPALRAIPLPDTSHMDASHKPAYTRALLQTLLDRGALRTAN